MYLQTKPQKDLEQFNVPVEVGNYIFSDRWQFDVDAKANSISRTDVPILVKTGLCLQPGDLITVDVHPLDFWSLGVGDSNLNFTTNGRRSNGTPEDFLREDPKNEKTVPPKAYFKTTAANPDKEPHVKALSADTFGFEDVYGGGDQDFDDMKVTLKVISVEDINPESSSSTDSQKTLTENDCPLYPLCKLSQLSNA
ncbi:DUF4114 domain-containing protein [Coleofasciculus sp.]|uniref:DUF4114 domain-containing protein n=1 Tax=Coleofasciculus sp. TaxID=3100458 RepID=UPI0039F8ACA2